VIQPLDLTIPILVVDDMATMTKIVCTLLRQLGFFNIDTASDGVSALEKIRHQPYSVIISDLNMAPMNGLELLRRGRTDSRFVSSFIMITGEAKPQHVIDAKRAGASGFLVKPFTAEALKAKIQEALASPKRA
jgi:two-component system, chemotaxis family, chemotaxis protein CheY